LKYKKIFGSLAQITLFGYVMNFYKDRKYFSYLKGVDTSRVKFFWDAKFKDKSKAGDRVILTDALMLHIGYNEKSFLTANLLRGLFNANVYALIPFSNSKTLIFLSNIFSINNVVSVYRFMNFNVLYMSIVFLIKTIPHLSYDSKDGIKIYVDNIEIGALIYDEYLRETNLHTMRNVDYLYIVFIFRSIYHYYRYKQIIKSLKITDIVIGHNVYAYWGLLVVAAENVNKNIIIWNCLPQGRKFGISHYKAQNPMPKPKYFKEEYLNMIRHEIEKNTEAFERNLSIVKENKFSGKIAGKDTESVYLSNKINTLTDFDSVYDRLLNKKSIVIYSHAFVDAVNYARWSLFSDYYTWLEETLIFMAVSQLVENIYIKPHPSESMYACDMTTEILVRKINDKYNCNFIYLDKQVNNNVIFEFVDLIITSNGTVATEAPMFGVNVLVCGESDCENSNSIIQVNNKEDYFNAIVNVNKLNNLDSTVVKRAEIAFYWYNIMTYANIPISLTATNDPLTSKDNFISKVKELNKIYNDNMSYNISKSKLYSLLLAAIEHDYQDLFDIEALSECTEVNV
jgi:hypothetical protein